MPTPASAGPTTSIVESPSEAAAIAEEWRALADDCGAGPFARPLFALTWWRHLGQGSLMVVTVREHGRLVALAPLHRRRLGPVRVGRWLGHGLGTVAEALVRPGHDDVAEAMWRTAAEHTHVLDLLECREGAPLPAPTAASSRPRPRDTCPVIDVQGDAETHLAAPARRRVRRTVRVARRRLAEDGLELQIRSADDPASLADLLPAIVQVFDRAEAHHPRQHLLAGPWAAFTTAVLQDGVAAGEVLVLLAEADGRPLAFDIILLTPTTMASWIGRFDPEAARFSPGHLLQCAGLDWAHAHDYAVIDLLLGDSYYKQLWADRSYRTLEVETGGAAACAALHAVAALREVRRRR